MAPKKDTPREDDSTGEEEKDDTDKAGVEDPDIPEDEEEKEMGGEEEKSPSSLGVTAEMLEGKAKKKEEEAAPLLCPDCGAELEEGMVQCPECGLELAEGEEMVCAVCGSPIDEGAEKCPLCGTRFTTLGEASEDASLPLEAIGHSKRRDRRPTVSIGPEKEAPVDEESDVPDRAKKPGPRATEAPRKKRRPEEIAKEPAPETTTSELMVMMTYIVVALFLTATILLYIYPYAGGVEIDGKFDDWEDVAIHHDPPDPGLPPSMTIDEYSVQTRDDDLFLYLKTGGDIFQDPSSSVVNIFIDRDGKSGTGYKFFGTGAEHRIEIGGDDGEVGSATLFSFSPTGLASNWRDFTETGDVPAAIDGPHLEVSAAFSSLGLHSDSEPVIMFSTKDSEGNMDVSETPVGMEPGGIVVTQYVKAPTTPIAQGTEGQVFLTLRVEAKGKDDTFNLMKLSRLGDGTPGDVSSISLWSGDTKVDDGRFEDLPGIEHQQVTLEPKLLVKTGKPVVLNLKMDIWERASGDTLGTRILSSEDLEFEKCPAILTTIQEDEMVTYINNTPLTPTVDGAFGDWNNANSQIQDVHGTSNGPNTDIITLRSRVMGDGHVIFQLEVRGQVLGGSAIPSYQPVNGTCGPCPRCPNTGEDTLIVYIDTDGNVSTGHDVGGLGAEYAVITHGKYGQVHHNDMGFYDYDNGKDEWEMISLSGVRTGTDHQRLEIEIDIFSTDLEVTGQDFNYKVELKDHCNFAVSSSVIEG